LAVETLRDGKTVQVRALRPEDRADLLAAIGRFSVQSRFQRFFTFKRGFTDQEADFYVNVDFVDHVALVAVATDGAKPVIVAGARYIVVGPGKAEVALAIDDGYQRQGLGKALLRHLAAIARAGTVNEFVADILPHNTAMLRVFEASGLKVRTEREPGAIRVFLQLSER